MDLNLAGTNFFFFFFFFYTEKVVHDLQLLESVDVKPEIWRIQL